MIEAKCNDSQGKMLEILKGIHELAFKGHVCTIEELELKG
jgi:hypothetical protein